MTFSSLAAGEWHTCGIRASDGQAQCWGNNSQGQSTPPAGVGFSSLAAGRYHTCGLKPNGSVACWGRNIDGQAPASVAGPFVQVIDS